LQISNLPFCMPLSRKNQ